MVKLIEKKCQGFCNSSTQQILLGVFNNDQIFKLPFPKYLIIKKKKKKRKKEKRNKVFFLVSFRSRVRGKRIM